MSWISLMIWVEKLIIQLIMRMSTMIKCYVYRLSFYVYLFYAMLYRYTLSLNLLLEFVFIFM